MFNTQRACLGREIRGHEYRSHVPSITAQRFAQHQERGTDLLRLRPVFHLTDKQMLASAHVDLQHKIQRVATAADSLRA